MLPNGVVTSLRFIGRESSEMISHGRMDFERASVATENKVTARERLDQFVQRVGVERRQHAGATPLRLIAATKLTQAAQHLVLGEQAR